ncbi:TadE/TadG family type IV pilus assembly protein [Bacillus sp. 1P06AnD]|uniref:TadE/TadG family type IV pilus assembly protein n=1 Tax=Bacillus sp. 1P06AnD TaxID=3132208 RepID=UPI0039A07805
MLKKLPDFITCNEWNARIRSEKGSATIEFLGILPLAILALLIVWQLIVGIHGVIVAQSAANEAAKVYSVTEENGEAYNAANKIVSSASGYLQMTSGSPINADSSRDFTSKVSVDIQLVFLPKKLFSGAAPSVPFTAEVSGRVIK